MKQHINPSQALELTSKQFYSMFSEVVERKDYWHYHHIKITIGKMIEILVDSKECIDIFNGNENGLLGEYCVWVGTLGETRKPELCDALWEAVKYVLDKE